MSDDTYRWLTAVWTPLLSVFVTAAVSGAVAIIATRMEAGRGESRARAAALETERKQAVLASWEWLTTCLELAANGVIQPGQNPIRHGPLEADLTLIGDPSAASSALEVMAEMAHRPGHSGLTPADVQAVADAENGLRVAARQQLRRVAVGQEPARFDKSELSPTVQERFQALVDQAAQRTMP